MTTKDASHLLAPRQFSLAGMLSVVLACAVYFGFLRIIGDYLEIFAPPPIDRIPFLPPSKHSISLLTILISWVALWAIYRRWGLRPALWIHFSGLAVFLPLGVLVAALVSTNAVGDHYLVILVFLSYGFFVCVLFGFPVVLLMLLVRFMRRT